MPQARRVKRLRAGISDGLSDWRNMSARDTRDKIHYDGTNCCFLDGHVEWLKFSVLMNIIHGTPDRTRGPWEWNPTYPWPPSAG
jgi:prepilin-type processing-associated H-X9-DG protein